jgi:hypothetical protein
MVLKLEDLLEAAERAELLAEIERQVREVLPADTDSRPPPEPPS